MATVDELRELTRQTRVRLCEVERLRTEHRLISAASDRRLRESRALLDRAEQRRAVPDTSDLHQV